MCVIRPSTSSLLNNHPLLSLTTLTSVSLLTTLLASLLSFYLFSPSLPASLSRPAVLPAPPSPTGAAKLRSSKREREWAASLPRAMDDITGDNDEDDQAAETDESTASSLLAEEEAREEQDLARLRAKEAELRRVRAELEAAEDRAADEREAEQRQARDAAAAAQEAARVAASAGKDDEHDDDGRSLLGGVSLCASLPPSLAMTHPC